MNSVILGYFRGQSIPIYILGVKRAWMVKNHCLKYSLLILTKQSILNVKKQPVKYPDIKLSSDEFQNWLKMIRNSTKKVEFKIWIWGRIWPWNLNSTKVDVRFCSNMVEFGHEIIKLGKKIDFLA